MHSASLRTDRRARIAYDAAADARSSPGKAGSCAKTTTDWYAQGTLRLGNPPCASQFPLNPHGLLYGADGGGALQLTFKWSRPW